MRKLRAALLFSMVVAVAGLVGGCDLFSGNSESGIVTLSGSVVNSATSDPIAEAFVQILPQDILTETNSLGQYNVEVAIDSTMTLTLVATKSGFSNGSTSLLAVADRTIDVTPILMAPETNSENQDQESGMASNILLESQSSTSIGVRESGSQEVAEIVFTVADSLGRPINLNNQIEVSFEFGVDPGEGAFIFPPTALTNASGQVKTNISSGTKAGVVQIIARATVGGRTIRSLPVALAIHGGLPDSEHFGVATEQFNVPRAWVSWGIPNGITAFAADQYSNPVRPNTVVYFTTTGGIVEGSGTTDPLGRASVTLISGPPAPVHPVHGNGYLTVTATTADRFDAEISSTVLVLFSGVAGIEVPTGQGALTLGRSYQFFVYDENQNPLGSGTRITVLAEGENVDAFGNTDVDLTDHLFAGPGVTDFTFGIQSGGQVDADGNPLPSKIEAVTIKVTSPNGNAERVILANGAILMRDDSGFLVPVSN